jgi:hypothetical protein
MMEIIGCFRGGFHRRLSLEIACPKQPRGRALIAGAQYRKGFWVSAKRPPEHPEPNMCISGLIKNYSLMSMKKSWEKRCRRITGNMSEIFCGPYCFT